MQGFTRQLEGAPSTHPAQELAEKGVPTCRKYGVWTEIIDRGKEKKDVVRYLSKKRGSSVSLRELCLTYYCVMSNDFLKM